MRLIVTQRFGPMLKVPLLAVQLFWLFVSYMSVWLSSSSSSFFFFFFLFFFLLSFNIIQQKKKNLHWRSLPHKQRGQPRVGSPR